jgi:hypothetical protein
MGRNNNKSFTYELEIFPTASLAAVLSAATGGDEAAQANTVAFAGWLERYSRGDPVDCFACGEPLVRAPAAIILRMPMAMRKGRQGVAGGVCATCATLPRPSLLQYAMVTIRAVMPSARLHVAPVPGGHA